MTALLRIIGNAVLRLATEIRDYKFIKRQEQDLKIKNCYKP